MREQILLQKRNTFIYMYKFSPENFAFPILSTLRTFSIFFLLFSIYYIMFQDKSCLLDFEIFFPNFFSVLNYLIGFLFFSYFFPEFLRLLILGVHSLPSEFSLKRRIYRKKYSCSTSVSVSPT
jgi:hypothetical protein